MKNYKTLEGILQEVQDTANTFHAEKDIPSAMVRLTSTNIAIKVHILAHAIDRFQTEKVGVTHAKMPLLLGRNSKKSKSKPKA